jgi:DNA-binding MarR family transcriptional regulator
MSAQTVNVLVRGLQACGLVRRREHPSHGRILQVSLTDQGREALRHGREVAFGVQERLLAGVAPRDRAALVRALRAVEEAAG